MNWDSEQECFDSFSREMSDFYAIQYDPYLIDSSSKSSDEDTTSTEDDKVCAYCVRVSVEMLRV